MCVYVYVYVCVCMGGWVGAREQERVCSHARVMRVCMHVCGRAVFFLPCSFGTHTHTENTDTHTDKHRHTHTHTVPFSRIRLLERGQTGGGSYAEYALGGGTGK